MVNIGFHPPPEVNIDLIFSWAIFASWIQEWEYSPYSATGRAAQNAKSQKPPFPLECLRSRSTEDTWAGSCLCHARARGQGKWVMFVTQQTLAVLAECSSF